MTVPSKYDCWSDRVATGEVMPKRLVVTVAALIEAQRPPVVITWGQEAGEIAGRLDSYREFAGEGRQTSLLFVIYIDERYAGDRGAETGSWGRQEVG